jgi:hypothetical protein
LPEVILETIFLLSIGESLKEGPNLMFSLIGLISLITLATVDFPRPVFEDTFPAERPDSERKRIWALIKVEMGFMVKYG